MNEKRDTRKGNENFFKFLIIATKEGGGNLCCSMYCRLEGEDWIATFEVAGERKREEERGGEGEGWRILEERRGKERGEGKGKKRKGKERKKKNDHRGSGVIFRG